jgi:hypothetical protein
MRLRRRKVYSAKTGMSRLFFRCSNCAPTPKSTDTCARCLCGCQRGRGVGAEDHPFCAAAERWSILSAGDSTEANISIYYVLNWHIEPIQQHPLIGVPGVPDVAAGDAVGVGRCAHDESAPRVTRERLWPCPHRMPMIPIMGMVRPWHFILLSLCCIVSIGVVIGGTVWAVLRSRGQR